MSLDRLLSQPLTIERRSGTTTDQYGNEVPATTASVLIVGYLEQTAATEVEVDRQTFVSDWLAVLPAGVDIDGSDRIVYAGTTYEVIGKPHHVWNPRRKATSHVEARLREVTG